MVGLSDIPFVGKLVERISDAAIDVLFGGCGYLFCYKDGVNNLNSEIEKLTNQELLLSRKIDAEKNNGKIIYDYVAKWKTDVEDFQKSAKEFEENYKKRSSWRCIQCLPIPKPVSRFQLGREAEHMAKRVTELSDSAKDLLANEIAHLPPLENLPNTCDVFQDFQSREDAYKKLWEALVTEDSSMILGIYGMPGVGKTRMMEQIWKEAKEKKIFDKVTRADVGNEKLDVIKLQNQIAEHLECKLESQDNEKSRASQLKNSLMNGGKILVILDDVWREIPLHRIGIPLGDGSSSKGCKILFTSRQEDVCLVNNCMHPVKITPLTINEAWDMFSISVGTNIIVSLQDESLARKVCEKCAGLPLLIRAVGKALQFTSHNTWKDALGQLEKGKVENIAGLDPQVYACVELSIDRLPDDAKSCLFLCSLYPEDAHIYIRKLIQLATGSLVPDGEARICAIVDNLRSSSLLLDSKEDHIIKLHDLIRDVARFIAVRDTKYAFSHARCGSKWLDNTDYATRKLLRLDLECDDVHFPDNLVCPDLHSLWLQCNTHIQQFSGGFFGMFVNLKFLLIEGMLSSLALQFSLQPLGKLRTLILDHCDITHIDQTKVSLFPQNLETLCIWDCHLPVPLDLSNLKNLKKLEIEGWKTGGVQLVPNTISNMPCLEELHIQPNGFKIWNGRSEISPDAVSSEILTEISKLTGLKSLRIFIRDFEPFQKTNIFGSLEQFNICVGELGSYYCYHPDRSASIKKSIELHGNNLQVLESLIERAEEVRLDCNDIDVSNIYNRNREAFTELRYLKIERCETMEYLARISEDEIQHSLRQPSFSKLTKLEIYKCSAMKYLLSTSVAKCLVQLETLSIEDCPMMEAIVMNEGTSDGDIINFSKLKSLMLINLPRLKSFYREKKDMHSSSTSSIPENSAIPLVQSQPLFDGMVAFPSLEYLYLYYLEDTGSDIWGKYYYNDSDNNNNNIVSSSFSSSFCKLKGLQVWCCDKLETVFPLGMLHSLRNLEDLIIERCNGLRNLLSKSVAKCLVQLESLDIRGCPMMEAIVMNEGTSDEDIINFSKLKSLDLSDLPRLKSFYREKKDMHFSSTSSIPEDSAIPLVQSQPLFDGMVAFPSLKYLTLHKLRDTGSDIWGKYYYNDSDNNNNVVSSSFCKLMRLEVRYCNKLETVFPLGMLHTLRNLEYLRIRDCNGLRNVFQHSSIARDLIIHLKTLKVKRCEMMREIIGGEADEQETTAAIIVFPELKELQLYDLPNLSRFWRCCQSGDANTYKVALPSLDSDNNNNIVSSSFSSSFCKLKSLRVGSCNKLETVIPLGMLHSLRNLEYISISNCNGLRNVFQHSSIARDLIHLKTLSVYGCEMMREIIGGEADEQETTAAIIVFPELKELELLRLPNLSRFWRCQSANTYKVHFPNLERIDIMNCGEIDLEAIELGRDDSTCQLRNLRISCDKEMQLPYKWLLRLCNLEELTLGHCWPHQLKSPCFQRLRELTVHNSGCSTLFTFSAFKCLQQLQHLKISNSDLLEGIVEDVRSDEASDMEKKIITLFQLEYVTLADLPNLKSFFQGANYECHMPALTKVKLNSCGLSTLFTCSVFGKLQQLEALEVSNCRLLEGIVEDVRDDETSIRNDKIITLSQLSSVVLRDLPNLKSFSSTSSYAFNMPNLLNFHLLGCPRVENFTSLKTSTKLVSVHSEWHQGEKFPDLNDYITQNHKRGSNLIDSAGESSYSIQELETESERVGEEQLQETEENDQP